MKLLDMPSIQHENMTSEYDDMISKPDAISESYTDDKWVLDISVNLHLNDNGVSGCQVPKWLSSSKPEAFIPQIVGLGPYHHSRPELIITDKLKLATAKRSLKHFDDAETLHQHLKNLVTYSDFEPFYNIDVNSTYNYQTLLNVLTVDGLFLLGLIHRGANANSRENSYFLTGKHGMAVVNAGGAQLTMDFIIRDVFMLENQIPIFFLKKIAEVLPTESNEIQSHGDPGLSMKSFCQALCPVVHFENLSKKPEEHYHLLDLMYRLIVPEELESELDSEPEPEPEHVPMPQCKPEPQSQPQPLAPPPPQSQGKVEQHDGVSCWLRCFNILFSLPALVWMVVAGIVKLILKLILWILKSLFRMVATLSKLVQLAFEALYVSLSKSNIRLSYLQVKHWAKISIDTSEEDGQEEDVRPPVTIPSVMELHNAGIHFRPSESSISSIEFDVKKCKFYLPVIKLDVNSEVIIRNLVAYESLTKSKGLFFTRYVQIMRSMIGTPCDVKLLVREKIIHTDLSDEVVAQLFNGMSKSIRPLKTPKLEQVINKVIAKFDSTQAVNRLLTKYFYSSWKFGTVVGGIIFLLLTAAQTYCSVVDCAGTTTRT